MSKCPPYHAWRILGPRTVPSLEEMFAHDGLNRLLTAQRNNASTALRTLTTAYGADRLGNHTGLKSSVSADP